MSINVLVHDRREVSLEECGTIVAVILLQDLPPLMR